MPKKALLPEQHDEPIWDAVLVDLGDPYPYQPAVRQFAESFRPDDERFVDPDYFDHLLYELAVEAEDAGQEFDAIRESTDTALDKIWPWPPNQSLRSIVVGDGDDLGGVPTSTDAPTLVMQPVRLAEITQEIPRIE